MRPDPIPLRDVPPERDEFEFDKFSDALAALKTTRSLIKGILDRDSIALIYGAPGDCKTFVALDLGLTCTASPIWCGHKVKPGPVLFIAGEGKRGVLRRIHAWCIARGVAKESLQVFISRSGVNLTDAFNIAKAVEAGRRVQRKYGVPPALIIVDTLARNFGPGDENSTQDMSAAIAGCDQLRAAFGACVLLVHHVGHGDKSRARGSSALNAALDMEYRVSRDESGVVRFECTKIKDHEPPAPLAFRLDTVSLGVTDEDGDPIRSAVLRPVSFEPVAKPGQIGRGKHQTLALRVLRDLESAHRARLDASGHDPDSARVSVQDWRAACLTEGVDRRRVSEVVSSLADAGRVAIEHGFATPLDVP